MLSQWVDDTPELVKAALTRHVVTGEALTRACTWVWFQCATSAEREEVDRWIVGIGHPLGFEPGTAENRFRAIVRELAAEYARMTPDPLAP